MNATGETAITSSETALRSSEMVGCTKTYAAEPFIVSTWLDLLILWPVWCCNPHTTDEPRILEDSYVLHRINFRTQTKLLLPPMDFDLRPALLARKFLLSGRGRKLA